jgi:hypothetical protein
MLSIARVREVFDSEKRILKVLPAKGAVRVMRRNFLQRWQCFWLSGPALWIQSESRGMVLPVMPASQHRRLLCVGASL